MHYCRKHYQRARYRSKEWPFTQCDLLLDSLDRMEEWRGVRCFEVVLRKREVERRGDVSAPGPSNGDRAVGAGEKALPSPVDSEPEDAETAGNAGVEAGTGDDDGDDDQDADYGQRRRRHGPPSQAKRGGGGAQSKRRRKPIIAPAPVPGWLRHEVGPQKSFDEVRGVVQRLRDYLTRLQDEGREDEIRFPDIEILPSFETWVLEGAAARRKQQRKRAGPGVES